MLSVRATTCVGDQLSGSVRFFFAFLRWSFIAAILGNACVLSAEDRSFDGSGNNQGMTFRGAADQPLVRITYPSFFMLDENVVNPDPNPRDVSNRVSRQTENLPSSRGLSDFIWGWGQFVAHDMSLTLTSNGPTVNGSAPIAITDPNDPLGPGAIPFTRSNFGRFGDNLEEISPFGCHQCREPINVNSSYIDASGVYGSSEARARALRSDNGNGPFLLTDPAQLLPRNTMGLENENTGPFADEGLFVAGDMRSNENIFLTAMHTVFVREHNRLASMIQQRDQNLSDEEIYQLARKIVGAEIQAITYNEFLPALMGNNAPAAADYSYNETENASITQSFAHAINRWGHSALSPQLQLVAENGVSVGHHELRHAFSNPAIIQDDPNQIEKLLRGAASQVSQEIDVFVVDELRNFLFGAPGAGGLDLVALNLQRGRDHGLPGYLFLQIFYGINNIQTDFSSSSIDPSIAEALESFYPNALEADAWIAALAEDHLPNSSLGQLSTAVTAHQFRRLRDGDRLFYLSEDAGLYVDGELQESIRELVDLDTVSLADLIQANTSIANLQDDVFFAAAGLPNGDFNQDGRWDCEDVTLLSGAMGGDDMTFDMNGDGQISKADALDSVFGWLSVGGAHNREMTAGNSMLLADANLDGAVDEHDFSVWAANRFTATAGTCSGDFNFDGLVDVSDFNLWNQQRGTTSTAAASAIPEPNFLGPFWGCLFLIVLHHNSRHRRPIAKSGQRLAP